MSFIQKEKLVIFGAGKIGRSFIGQLFSRGGYEVVFIDVFKPVIDELNKRGSYNVIVKADKEEILQIKNVRGVLASDEDNVIEEISSASIMAVSVGLNAIPKIIPLLAKGLINRFESRDKLPIDIILAENLRDAAEFFHERLIEVLPPEYPLDQMVGLVETSIGKMVPIMRKKDSEEDILQVFAEPYNTLILDKKAFKNAIPDIEGLAPKENMKAWVDRKLFIHNLGHATTAYLGYLYDPKFIFLYEALNIPEIIQKVRSTMLQAADLLLKKYPGEFTLEALTDHVDDLLSRFKNRNLGDTIFRVGCDLSRKLSSQDRLAGAIHLANKLNLPYNKILFALICGCQFRSTNEEEVMLPADIEFSRLYEKGIKTVLTNVCAFVETNDYNLFGEAEDIDRNIKRGAFQTYLTNRTPQ
jgi:mannitol-1-phosphate 5-dehydrogenase